MNNECTLYLHCTQTHPASYVSLTITNLWVLCLNVLGAHPQHSFSPLFSLCIQSYPKRNQYIIYYSFLQEPDMNWDNQPDYRCHMLCVLAKQYNETRQVDYMLVWALRLRSEQTTSRHKKTKFLHNWCLIGASLVYLLILFCGRHQLNCRVSPIVGMFKFNSTEK